MTSSVPKRVLHERQTVDNDQVNNIKRPRLALVPLPESLSNVCLANQRYPSIGSALSSTVINGQQGRSIFQNNNNSHVTTTATTTNGLVTKPPSGSVMCALIDLSRLSPSTDGRVVTFAMPKLQNANGRPGSGLLGPQLSIGSSNSDDQFGTAGVPPSAPSSISISATGLSSTSTVRPPSSANVADSTANNNNNNIISPRSLTISTPADGLSRRIISQRSSTIITMPSAPPANNNSSPRSLTATLPPSNIPAAANNVVSPPRSVVITGGAAGSSSPISATTNASATASLSQASTTASAVFGSKDVDKNEKSSSTATSSNKEQKEKQPKQKSPLPKFIDEFEILREADENHQLQDQKKAYVVKERSSKNSMSNPCKIGLLRCITYEKYARYIELYRRFMTTPVDKLLFQEDYDEQSVMERLWPTGTKLFASRDEQTSSRELRYYLYTPRHFGSLHVHVVDRKRLAVRRALRFYKQIVETAAFCHARGVVLRDVKLRKFVFADERRTRVRFFDLDELHPLPDALDDTMRDRNGCPAYVSPEIIDFQSKSYAGKPADMWGLGVLLYVMLVGRYPFYDTTPVGLFIKIRSAQFGVPPSAVDLPYELRCLVRFLLRKEPRERLTAWQLLQLPCLKLIDDEDFHSSFIFPSSSSNVSKHHQQHQNIGSSGSSSSSSTNNNALLDSSSFDSADFFSIPSVHNLVESEYYYDNESESSFLCDSSKLQNYFPSNFGANNDDDTHVVPSLEPKFQSQLSCKSANCKPKSSPIVAANRNADEQASFTDFLF